ncbi:AAA family ATPase [Aquibium carbonis]|nr:AAA family ATPase [Aquibium carbonis]
MTKKAYFKRADAAAARINRWKDLRRDLPRFIAYAQLRRACRSVPQVVADMPVVAGFVIREQGDLELYDKAARRLAHGFTNIYGREREAVVTTVSSTKEKKTAAGSLDDAIGKERSFVLVPDRDLFPLGFEPIADLVAEIGLPDARTVSSAARACLDLRLSDAEAQAMSGRPLRHLATALRKGRTVSKALDVLARLQEMESQFGAPLDPGPTLDDLPGMGEAAEWGRRLAIDLSDWGAGKIPWADVDRGILISGPPGCGKTTFATALARTCKVPIVLGSLARWQAQGHLGDCLRAMRNAFAEATKTSPSILFVDEVDSFGDREQLESTSRNAQYCREVINAFLECLDGAQARAGVVVVGATNFPNAIDQGIRRPGRLDRHFEISLPDAEARGAILRLHLGVDIDREVLELAAARTEGWSGARLEQLARDARRRARAGRRQVTASDLADSLPRRIRVPDEVKQVAAVHEAGHAVAGIALGRDLVSVEIAETVEGEGSSRMGGATAFRQLGMEMRDTQWYRDRIAILLAGTAAEEVVLGRRSSGAGGLPGSDLHDATVTALALEASYGLGHGYAYLARSDDESLLQAMRFNIGLQSRVEAMLREEMDRIRSIIRQRERDIRLVADMLISRSGATGDEVRACLSRPPISSSAA